MSKIYADPTAYNERETLSDDDRFLVANSETDETEFTTISAILAKTGVDLKLMNKEDSLFEIITANATYQGYCELIKEAISDIALIGDIDDDTEYSLVVVSNNSTYRRLRIFSNKDSVDTEICSYVIYQSAARDCIEQVSIPQYNSSGFTANVIIDWSKIPDINYIGLYNTIWKLTPKALNIAAYSSNSGKLTPNLIMSINELSLLNWELDVNIVRSTATGWSNYAYYNSDLNEDKFSLACKVKDIGGGYFEIGIGKRATLSGTAITLRYDESGSYLCFWGMTSYSSPTELTAFRQVIPTLNSGQEYLIKVTKDVNLVSVELIYDDGTTFEYETSELGFYFWGFPTIYCIEGQCEASSFNFSMPYNRAPKIIVFGDSFVEGNSISDNKDMRYSALLAEDVGTDDVVLLGKGGETTTSVLPRFYKQVEWYQGAKYAIIALGTNDYDFSVYKENILKMVLFLKKNNIIPVLVTVTNRQDTSNTDFQSVVNPYVRSLGEKYIDMSLAISEDGDETLWRDDFQKDDNVHPSITGHEYMYRRIKFDAPYLFY
jgi:lysophospholipase L1-like esterase